MQILTATLTPPQPLKHLVASSKTQQPALGECHSLPQPGKCIATQRLPTQEGAPAAHTDRSNAEATYAHWHSLMHLFWHYNKTPTNAAHFQQSDHWLLTSCTHCWLQELCAHPATKHVNVRALNVGTPHNLTHCAPVHPNTTAYRHGNMRATVCAASHSAQDPPQLLSVKYSWACAMAAYQHNVVMV